MHTAHLAALSLFASMITIGCNGSNVSQDSAGDGYGTDTDGVEDSSHDAESESDGGDSSRESDDGGGGPGFPDDSDSGGETGGIDLNCGGDSIVVDVTPSNVMLVLDKSGSMTSNTWDHDNDADTSEVTRWHSLHEIVDGIVTDHEADTNLGAVLFPAGDAGGDGAAANCQMEGSVDVPLAASNAAAIMSGIPSHDADTDGGTPARAGVQAAVDHFAAVDPQGSRAIILVTDGAANCVPGVEDFWTQYDDELAATVAGARDELGVMTYVVGIDIEAGIDPNTGVDVEAELATVADAGGVGPDDDLGYYAAGDHLALQNALQEISSRVQCTVALPNLPARRDEVAVWVEDAEFARVQSCDEGAGWRFTSDDGDTIELCGAACSAFQEAGTLDTEYRCPPAK